ncbi:MAG: hypothetical protein DI617_01995 [Streptococcus pyogenes]|nr:MAG: hypothetical protein DI617_01995 [Streptococcus pyogenes]
MKTTTTGYKPGEKNLKSSTGPFDSHKWGMGTYSGLWKLWLMKTTTTGYKPGEKNLKSSTGPFDSHR